MPKIRFDLFHIRSILPTVTSHSSDSTTREIPVAVESTVEDVSDKLQKLEVDLRTLGLGKMGERCAAIRLAVARMDDVLRRSRALVSERMDAFSGERWTADARRLVRAIDESVRQAHKSPSLDLPPPTPNCPLNSPTVCPLEKSHDHQ